MASGQDDSIVTVLTCEGNISDPDFPYKLSSLVARLRRLLTSDKPFRITNVEPWNSVRVTFDIPREAAQRLRLLAQAGDRVLRDLGILSVQIEGDQVISLTIAGQFNEPQEILLRAAEDDRMRPSSSSSSFDVPGLDVVPASSNVDSTRKNIAQYLGQQGSVCSAALVAVASPTGQDAVFHGPRSPPNDFKSPNVVAPGSEPIPFPPKVNPAPTSRTPTTYGPFPFASMTHAMNTMHSSHHSASPAATTPPGSSPGRFPFSPPPTYPGSSNHMGAFQPVRHSSSFSPHQTSNSATTTAASSSPTSTATSSTVINNLPRGVADRANAVLTSPLLVNLLQSDLSSGSQPQQVAGKVFPPPPAEPAAMPKRKRKPRKSKEKTPTGSTANSPSASPLASSPGSCLSVSSLGTPASDSISHPLFSQPFGIALPTVPGIPPSPPSLTPPSASPPSLVGRPFASMDTPSNSRPVVSTSFAHRPLHRVPPLPSPPPTAPSSSASTGNNSGQSSQEAEHELSPWPSPSKRTQHLINPFTGQLEPMSSEDDEDDSVDDIPRRVPCPNAVLESSSRSSSSSQSNPFSDIGKSGDVAPAIRRVAVVGAAAAADAMPAEAKSDETASPGRDASSSVPSSPPSVPSTSVVAPAPSGGSPSEKIKLRLKLEPKPRIEKEKESGRLGEKQKSDGGTTPLLQYKVDVSFVNIPTRRLGSAGCPGVAPPMQASGAAPATPACFALASTAAGSTQSFSGNGTPSEPRVPPLHISLRGRNAAVVTNPRREDRDRGRPQAKEYCEPAAVEQPAVKVQRSRSPRGTRADAPKGNPVAASDGTPTGRRSSISRGGGHARRGRAASTLSTNATTSALMSVAGPRHLASPVAQSSPLLENKSPSPPLNSQSSVGREKTLLSGGSLVVEPGNTSTSPKSLRVPSGLPGQNSSAAAAVGNVQVPRLDSEHHRVDERERRSPTGLAKPQQRIVASSNSAAAESSGSAQARPPVQPARKSEELGRLADSLSQGLGRNRVAMQRQPPHVASDVPADSSETPASRTAQGRSGSASSELNALLDIPVPPMNVPLTRRSSRDVGKNEDFLASVVVRGVRVANLSVTDASGRSSLARGVSSTATSRVKLPLTTALQQSSILDERFPAKTEVPFPRTGGAASVDISQKTDANATELESTSAAGLTNRTEIALHAGSRPGTRNPPLNDDGSVRSTSRPVTEDSPVASSATMAIARSSSSSDARLQRTTTSPCHVGTGESSTKDRRDYESIGCDEWEKDSQRTSGSARACAGRMEPTPSKTGFASPPSAVGGRALGSPVSNLGAREASPDAEDVPCSRFDEALPHVETHFTDQELGSELAAVCRAELDDPLVPVVSAAGDSAMVQTRIADDSREVVQEVSEVLVKRPVQRVCRSPDSRVSPDSEETDVPSVDMASSPSGIPRVPRSSKLSTLGLSAGIGSANLSRLIPSHGGGVLVGGVMRVVEVDGLPEEEVDVDFVGGEAIPRHRHRLSNSSAIVTVAASSPCSASPSGSSPDSLNIGISSEDNGDQGNGRMHRDRPGRHPTLPRNQCNSSGSPYEDSGIDSMDAIMEKLSSEDSPGDKAEESAAASHRPASLPLPALPPNDDDDVADRRREDTSSGTSESKDVLVGRRATDSNEDCGGAGSNAVLRPDGVQRENPSSSPPTPVIDFVVSNVEGKGSGVEPETSVRTEETVDKNPQNTPDDAEEMELPPEPSSEEAGVKRLEESENQNHSAVEAVVPSSETGPPDTPTDANESTESPVDSCEQVTTDHEFAGARPVQKESTSSLEAVTTQSPSAAPHVVFKLCTPSSTGVESGSDTSVVNQSGAGVVQVHDAECSEEESLLASVVFRATDDDGTERVGTDHSRESHSEATRLLVFTVRDVDSIVMAENCNDEMSVLHVTSTDAEDDDEEGAESRALEFSTASHREMTSDERAAESASLEAVLQVDTEHVTENFVDAGGTTVMQLSSLDPNEQQVHSCSSVPEEQRPQETEGGPSDATVSGADLPTTVDGDSASVFRCNREQKVCSDGVDVHSSKASVGHVPSLPNHISLVGRTSLSAFRSVCNSSSSSMAHCGSVSTYVQHEQPTEAILRGLVSQSSRQVTLPIKFVTLPAGVKSHLLAPCGLVAENGGVALARSVSSSTLGSSSPVKGVVSHVGCSSTTPTVTLTTVVVKSPVSPSIAGTHPERMPDTVTSTVTVGNCPRVSANVSPVRTANLQVPTLIPIGALSPIAHAAPLPTPPLLRPVECAGSNISPSKICAAAESVPSRVCGIASSTVVTSSCPPLYSKSQPSTSLGSSRSPETDATAVASSASWQTYLVSGTTTPRVSPLLALDRRVEAAVVSTAFPMPRNASPATPSPASLVTLNNVSHGGGGARGLQFGSQLVCVDEGKQDSMGSDADTDSSTSSMSSLSGHHRGREDGNLSKDEADDLYAVNLSITSGDHNYIFRASRMTTREKERDRLQRAERARATEASSSVEAANNCSSNSSVGSSGCGTKLDPLSIEIPSEGETGEAERRSTRSTRSNSRLASPSSGRHSAASQPLSPSARSCVASPVPSSCLVTSDTETEIRTLPNRSAARRRRDDSEDSDTERRKTSLSEKDDVSTSSVASSATVKSADRDGSVTCPKSPVCVGLHAHVYSKPVKRKCSENAVELIKACIGVDDSPKRVAGGKQQPAVTEMGRTAANKGTKIRDDGNKLKGRPNASAGDASEESSDDEVALSELATKARSGKLKQMEDRSTTRNSKQRQNTKDEEVMCGAKTDRVNSRAIGRREEGRSARNAGTLKESRKEERTSTRVGGRHSDRGKRALSPLRGQERSPHRTNHRSRTRDHDRAASPHNPKEGSEAGKRKLRSSGASGYYDSLPQKRRRLSRDNR